MIYSSIKETIVSVRQETGRLAAMDLVEVNPALANTQADLGRCKSGPETGFWTGTVRENLRSTSGLELGARTLLAGAYSLTNGEL